MKYLQRKRRESLFNQWVKQSGLPPEEVSLGLHDKQSTKETELANDDIPQERLSKYTAMTDTDKGMVRLPIRYVLLGLSVIGLLLVALSVVITILITRS